MILLKEGSAISLGISFVVYLIIYPGTSGYTQVCFSGFSLSEAHLLDGKCQGTSTEWLFYLATQKSPANMWVVVKVASF